MSRVLLCIALPAAMLLLAFSAAAHAELSKTPVVTIRDDGTVVVEIWGTAEPGMNEYPAPVPAIPATIEARLGGSLVSAIYSGGKIYVAASGRGSVYIDYLGNVTEQNGVLQFLVNYTGLVELRVSPGVVLLSLPEGLVNATTVNNTVVLYLRGPATIRYVLAPQTPPTATAKTKTGAAATTSTPASKTSKTTATTFTTTTTTTKAAAKPGGTTTTTRTSVTRATKATSTTTASTTARTATATSTTTPAAPVAPATTSTALATTRLSTTMRPATTTGRPSSPPPAAGSKGPSTALIGGVAAVLVVAVAAGLALARRGGVFGGGGGVPSNAAAPISSTGLDEVDLLILSKLEEHGGSVLQSQLLRETGIPKTTLWRHVRRLAAMGYIRIVKEGKANRLILLKKP
ncbi:hypothetical protein CF15_06800 [Pyrodictium occultum]|uniref:HTH iclR-type domain-containing protein n=1 Tax=Pyrodictium occultum TaxID=2309 RepID=A0A0V8RWM2_PYROC|nr:winged helix-turn-helix transcriptional regulator [Pyrodictium occultum]KSW12429.1 hypothetical protein CF15_06800 [Pyrodictium occultum]